MSFDQRSPQPPEVAVLRWHRYTYIQIDGHGNSRTESAQFADSVKMQLFTKRPKDKQTKGKKTIKDRGP